MQRILTDGQLLFFGIQRLDGDCWQVSEPPFARVWRRWSAFAIVALKHLLELPAGVVFIGKVGLPLWEVEFLAMKTHQPFMKSCRTVGVFGNENLQFVGQSEGAAVKQLIVKRTVRQSVDFSVPPPDECQSLLPLVASLALIGNIKVVVWKTNIR